MPDHPFRMHTLMPLIREQLSEGNSVQFTPQGVSMRPMLYGGRDQVILSPLPKELKKYDLPLYQRDNGQYVLHRIIETGETYTCIGDNQYYVEEGVRPDQMIAIATAFIRKGKRYSVDDLSYRMYCRFWMSSRQIRRFFRKVRIKTTMILRGSEK